MIKLCGALLIMLGCVYIGCAPIYAMNQRSANLYAYWNLLERMKAELETYHHSIPQLFLSLLRLKNKHTQPFIQSVYEALISDRPNSFHEVWRSYIQQKLAVFGEEEREMLLYLGESLGCYSIEEQAIIINRSISRFRVSYEETIKRSRELRKLYPPCSAAVGILLVITLL